MLFLRLNVHHLLQSFLLKVVSRKADGNTSVVKSVPCEAGSSTELCMVEVRIAVHLRGPDIRSHLVKLIVYVFGICDAYLHKSTSTMHIVTKPTMATLGWLVKSVVYY